MARPGQRGRVTIGLVESPCKISNSQEVTSSGDFFDVVGNNPCCTNQVDEVREEQLDRGVARPSLSQGKFFIVKSKGQGSAKGH